MALKSGRKLQPSRSRRPQIFKNPKAAFALALISMDALLVALIIAYVPYTKIDWDAYMSQVTGFLGGERDYTNLKGDTGPLVYPAGFLYIYSAIRFITGGEVYPAQILFGILYTINLSIVIFIYVKTEVLPWWALILLSLSKRVHSIFVLRLFNDCFAMTLLHAALATLLYQKWHLGLILFSGAVSIKMNVLLYAPPLLLLMLKAMNIYGVISALACAALVQILVGLPFLVSYPVAYISGAFNLGRLMLVVVVVDETTMRMVVVGWLMLLDVGVNGRKSVNFKFIPEPVFVSKQFAISLLIAHLGLLAAFAHYKWCRHEGGLFKFLHSKVISALSSSSSSGLKILKEEHIMTTLFAGNFIGILALSIVENTFPNITPVWSFAGISILQTFIHLLFFSVFICLYSGAYGLLNLNILMRKMNCPPERSKNEYPKFFFSFVSEEFSLSSDDGHDSEDPKQSTADMTAFVQRLLQQMSIDELRAEMGVEGSPSPLAPSKVMTEEDSA
uniref:dolichyl-P-Man:Man5GlcNAc2-PP-dolichol alpha-1,3-mannosyltransferase n=1 Tax=Salix viminalis TaxID=40686 RepID=A0A6N2M9M1_SALVM